MEGEEERGRGVISTQHSSTAHTAVKLRQLDLTLNTIGVRHQRETRKEYEEEKFLKGGCKDILMG